MPVKPSIEGQGSSSESSLATLIAAAGDSMRLSILALVLERPLSVTEICSALSAAQPRVSHHLAILKRSGLLEAEVQGRRRFYRWPTSCRGTPEAELQAFLRRWLEPEKVHPPYSELTSSKPKRPAEELEDFLL